MELSLGRADLSALDLDFGRLIGKHLIIPLCAMLGCLVAGLKHDEHRRIYRLSGSMPCADDILRPLLLVGAIICAFLWYECWPRGWTQLLITGFALGLAGGFAYSLAFGVAHWFCERLSEARS